MRYVITEVLFNKAIINNDKVSHKEMKDSFKCILEKEYNKL